MDDQSGDGSTLREPEKLGDSSQELLLSVAPFFQVEEGCQQYRKLIHDDFSEKLGDASLELLLSAEIIISFHSSSPW